MLPTGLELLGKSSHALWVQPHFRKHLVVSAIIYQVGIVMQFGTVNTGKIPGTVNCQSRSWDAEELRASIC